MIKIHEKELEMDGKITTITGRIQKILTVQYRPNIGPCVWYQTNEAVPNNSIKIIAIRTNWDVPKTYWNYIGTIQDRYGLVWHYYATSEEYEEED